MRTTSRNNYNIKMLMTLPLTEKVNIINRLIKSMSTVPVQKKSDMLPMFSGAWDDVCTTEEQTEELRASRIFTKEIESW